MSREIVPVSNLHFDPENPRLPLSKREATEAEILEYFIKKENLFDLISSIGQNGFYSTEALLVVPADHIGQNQFYVVEGNRRLAALKLLNTPSLAPIRLSAIEEIVREARIKRVIEVPVVIHKAREEVLDYLGYRHITGVEEWDSLAKARYLEQLYQFHKNDDNGNQDIYKTIAKIIGSRADYVRKLIRGFVLYKSIKEDNYYEIEGLNEESISFSLITTAVSYKNISDFLELTDEGEESKFNSNNLEELCRWIFEKGPENQKRIPDSRDLSTLNTVIANETALKVFRDGKPINEARRFTDEPMEFFRKSIDEATKLIDGADDQKYLINRFEKTDIDRVIHLRTKVIDLLNSIKNRGEQDLD